MLEHPFLQGWEDEKVSVLIKPQPASFSAPWPAEERTKPEPPSSPSPSPSQTLPSGVVRDNSQGGKERREEKRREREKKNEKKRNPKRGKKEREREEEKNKFFFFLTNFLPDPRAILIGFHSEDTPRKPSRKRFFFSLLEEFPRVPLDEWGRTGEERAKLPPPPMF
jgi:hypothetical protein